MHFHFMLLSLFKFYVGLMIILTLNPFYNHNDMIFFFEMDKFTPIEAQSLMISCDADAGPSIVPTKRGRGRPKGSEKLMNTTKSNTVPTKRGRGRPKG